MKSEVSDQLRMAHCIYRDACAMCSADVSDLRDLITIESRVKKEGLSFLTISLPAFAGAFERCLEAGRCGPADFPGFGKHGAIPAFLQGMLAHVFDRETGLIMEKDDSSVFVDAIRQICLAWKKMELPCTLERKDRTIDEFLQIEQDLSTFTCPEGSRFHQLVARLWTGVLGDIHPGELVPRHGPGATAERISGNQKFVWRSWHERLERVFPFLGYGLSVNAAGEDEFEKVTFLPPTQEPPSRLVLVPKTLKSPRTIAIEPVCMQYAQQAVASVLMERIESSPLIGGQINFTDQTMNRRLALESSSDGKWATIDLSSASDRVPRRLALDMFRVNPYLRELVDACRTRRMLLPSGRVIPLRKFASMGNALTFPVEAMYFYTVCVEALLAVEVNPNSRQALERACRSVFVYGDDIVVPTEYADAVLDNLAKYNCRVNLQKTFKTGKFRESCGLDAYAGAEVTTIYIRRVRPRDRKSVQEVASWVATANLFYKKGFWHTAAHMYSVCEKILGFLPYGTEEYPGLCRVSFQGWRSIERWDPQYNHPQSKGWVVEPVDRSDLIDGYSALQASLLSLERSRPSGKQVSPFAAALARLESAPRASLERTSLRGAATLKLRWNPA